MFIVKQLQKGLIFNTIIFRTNTVLLEVFCLFVCSGQVCLKEMDNLEWSGSLEIVESFETLLHSHMLIQTSFKSLPFFGDTQNMMLDGREDKQLQFGQFLFDT